jgi:hypothetical protein
MMTVSKVFRSPNSDWTLGFEFIVFDENLFSPSTSCTRRFQICVGKNDEGMFRVYILAIKEDKILPFVSLRTLNDPQKPKITPT